MIKNIYIIRTLEPGAPFTKIRRPNEFVNPMLINYANEFVRLRAIVRTFVNGVQNLNSHLWIPCMVCLLYVFLANFLPKQSHLHVVNEMVTGQVALNRTRPTLTRHILKSSQGNSPQLGSIH